MFQDPILSEMLNHRRQNLIGCDGSNDAESGKITNHALIFNLELKT